MILEEHKSEAMDLTDVGADSSNDFEVLDFHAEHQGVVTRHELEIFVTEEAAAAVDKTPTLAFTIATTDEEGGDYTTIATTPTYELEDLVKGAVLYRAALPASMDRIVKITAANAAAATNEFTAGAIFMSVRPM